MKTIYVDVLIILNIYVNFFLLKATARLTHTPLKTSKCIVSSIIGSIFSLIILLPKMHFLLNLTAKLTAAAVITASAFGIKDVGRTLKLIFNFYLVNFIFGGTIMLFCIAFKPGFMTFTNSYLYIDFSLISLVVFTAAAYAAVNIFRRFLDRGNFSEKKYTVSITCKGRSTSLEALADTGNNLVDMFSGKPVIICRKDEISDITGLNAEPTPENAELLYKEYGIRFIPYSTIGSLGMIAVFTPDKVVIQDNENGKTKCVDAMIGINPKDVPAIFNPKLL